MKREEFIKWMDEITIFSKGFIGDYYLEVDYANCIRDYIYVNDDSVEYVWENLYWGGSSTEKREFKFEEFMDAYENNTIKW
jgi:hypothetical protein